LHLAGRPVPRWEEPTPSPRLPPLLGEYCEFRRRHAGVAVSTLATEAKLLSRFLGWLRDRGMQPHEIGLPAVDDFITAAGERYCRKTVAGMCSRLRPFLRFMHQQGHIAHDISSSVASPRLRPAERPARALPWGDVQRMIGAIDMSDRTGKRDYALLLMMLTYGMGSAEAIGVTLDDINWRAGSLRVVRPKTGVEFHLPLLPAVAEAVVGYLRGGRPSATGTRAVFVREVAPYGPMTSSAVRQVVRKHAIAAGIEATPLGGHILRHTHASRELELGAPAKVVGDILGHKDPASISHYVRVATDSLRDLSLAVPK